METVKVQITIFDGKNVISTPIRSAVAQFVINDETMEILHSIAMTLPPNADENKCIDRDVIVTAINDGYVELEKMHEHIIDYGRELITRYRVYISTNNMDESVESAFWRDVEDGIYKPVLTIDEFTDYRIETTDKEDIDDGEDRLADAYYETYSEEYLKWVKGHLTTDCRFVADRLGVDTTDIYCGEADDHIYYLITF